MRAAGDGASRPKRMLTAHSAGFLRLDSGAGEQTLERGSEGPEGALKMFQTAKNIAPDGIVGPQTWAKLEAGDEGDIAEEPDGEVAGESLRREGERRLKRA